MGIVNMIDHYYSDPHFGHANIIKLCHRPFNSIQEMNEELIKRYNEAVDPSETVLWVGDAFFGSKDFARDTLSRLHGTKLLVKGNHDRSSRVMSELGFDLVCKEMHLNMPGVRVPVRVCHYPWKRHAKDGRHQNRHPEYSGEEVLIHGHTHSMTQSSGNQIHVGVDAWDFRPASHAEVVALMGEAGFLTT